jgi:undecaprenyl phosphate-alpha-L-ara4N flippase subunit ArnE
MRPHVLMLLVAGAVLAAAGQVFFKLGATGRVALVEFFNPAIGFGLACYGLGTAAWIYALSKAPLTVVYPFTALTYVIVYTCGVFLLGEVASVRAAAGVMMVLLGLLLLAS